MNYILALVIMTFSVSSAWAMSCVDLLSGVNKAAIVQERDSFRDAYKSLAAGETIPAAFQITPANREVSIWVAGEKGGSFSYDGRIVEVRQGASGVEVLFSRKDYNGNYARQAEVVPLSRIDANSVTLRKVVGVEEQQVTVGRFQESIQAGEHVTFIDQFGGLHQRKGRIARLERDQSGKVKSYVLAEDNGMEVMGSISSIDPASIRTFKVEPRQLNASEATLVAELKDALAERRYVSFQAKHGSQIGRYEGWITDVEVGTDGEYLFRVNENKCDLRCGSHKYRLSNIVAASFEARPMLMVRETGEVQNGGRAAAQVVGYSESIRGGTKQSVAISQNLYSELSVFADSKQASGSRLPHELEDLVAPASELRIYFASGERRIRLTVRRSANGSWSFGDTSFDRLSVNESYLDEHFKSRYTLNERDRLEDSRFADRLPAARLRDHMMMIRNGLMKSQVEIEFQSIQKEWSKSIPEDVDNAEVVGLLLHDQGQHFSLNRGFVRDELSPLSEVEAKKLAAIKYLVSNNLVFYSYNAGASQIKMGIYPQGSVKPSSMWLTGYDFGRSLFESMDAAGLQYTNGQWGPK
jgi:hypothetical protein